MFPFVFKALITEMCNCTCAKKIVTLIRMCHTCVALKHEKIDLSLETSVEINFEFITFVKKCKLSPFDEIQCLVIFDLSRFSINSFYQIR